MSDYEYLSGFGGYFQSEAEEGALPKNQNSPQRAPLGLYPEQLSGTAFTMPRNHNQYSWLYRICPSVKQGEFELMSDSLFLSPPFNDKPSSPSQMRWSPLPEPQTATDFIGGIVTIAGHGDPASHSGAATHLYCANKSMDERYFYNADGDMLIVPQQGRLLFKTEFGHIEVQPMEIAVIPRGVKFQVALLDDIAKGYVCENFGAHFILPDLGPIGANGLAHPRHFLSPTAAYEERTGQLSLVTKYQGHLWQAPIGQSPLDVVAWHGNYTPYKYDLRLFNTINTVSFDHPDPSIFTVLTSQTTTPGLANIDFVIFPPRWMVAEDTFRPPYYHRNIMSEYMGLIQGQYDAKPDGFLPGGGSIHNCMSSHGPDKQALDKAMAADLKPQRYKNTMAFMFESCFAWRPTDFAMESEIRQKDYLDCWQSLQPMFKKS